VLDRCQERVSAEDMLTTARPVECAMHEWECVSVLILILT